MLTDKKRLARLQQLDQCLADFTTDYTLTDLMAVCGASRATIERDLKSIKDKHGKDVLTYIKCGKKHIYRYKVPGFSTFPDEITSTQLAQIKSIMLMLNKFVGKPQFEYLQSIIRDLEKRYQVEIPDTETIIHFDGNIYVKGIEHLVPLFEAIVNKQCIQVVYQPFDGQKRVYIAHPYLLKEYNQRWYLLCNVQERVEDTLKLRTLSLDRIESLHDIASIFQQAPEEVEGYFDDVIGITKKEDNQHRVKDIIIKCHPKEFKYINTKPIHPSQQAIKGMPYHIKLKVKENYELYQWLLFYGDKIEVVAPEEIRHEFMAILQRMSDKYHK